MSANFRDNLRKIFFSKTLKKDFFFGKRCSCSESLPLTTYALRIRMIFVYYSKILKKIQNSVMSLQICLLYWKPLEKFFTKFFFAVFVTKLLETSQSAAMIQIKKTYRRRYQTTEKNLQFLWILSLIPISERVYMEIGIYMYNIQYRKN